MGSVRPGRRRGSRDLREGRRPRRDDTPPGTRTMRPMTASDPFTVATSVRLARVRWQRPRHPGSDRRAALGRRPRRGRVRRSHGGRCSSPRDAVDGARRRCSRHSGPRVATTADSVIVEGWLTRQVAGGDVGTYTGPDDAMPSASAYIGTVLLGSRSGRRQEAIERLEAAQAERDIGSGEPVDLVVVDLLWLDGDDPLRRPAAGAQAPARIGGPAERIGSVPASTCARRSTPGSGRGAHRDSGA